MPGGCAFVESAEHIFVVENNYTGQLERLVRYVVGPLERMHAVLKYDGRPFRPLEIIEPIERLARLHVPVEVKH